ncbi:MAG TPA: hypothetical protein VNO21_07065 [Polyangiaceae bacterium]|nr:hypothetical protein [Polyangiaceae bacterium]
MRKTSRFLVAIAFGLSAGCIGSAALSTPAFAQSVSDLQSARNLFHEGLTLQTSSRFAEALDRFTRANAVVNAPTNMLHMAECHAALGHLVEAVEIYRSLQRYPLPPNPPQAYLQAIDQGREELKTVEPRVPELKVDVTPTQVPTLNVTIDDQPLNPALVGVSRPINPGPHKVAASAPGYTRAEQSIDIKEKSRQAVALNLLSTGGVIYGPAGANASGSSSPYVTISQAPQGTAPSGTIDRPAPYTEGQQPRPPDLRSRTSIFFGPRLGLAIPAGNYVANNVAAVSMSEIAKPGGDIGIEGGIRFARIFYFSLLLEYAKYGDQTTSSGTASVTYSTKSSLLGGKFGIITNPNGFAFLADIGAGYREFSLDAVPSSANPRHSSANTAEFLVGVGLHFKAGKYIRLVPKVEAGFGSFGNSNVSSTAGAFSNDQSGSHSLWTIGLAGYFDIDLDKHSAATTTATTAP